MTQYPIRTELEKLLTAHFSPTHLDIQDDSYRHAGHGGSRPEGETHFRVTIVSANFAGQNRVVRQRAVNAVLKPLLDMHIHALQLFTHTPDEFANR